MGEDWIRTTERLPAEGALVDTIGPSGIEQPLRRRGSLWFHRDMSMYVYYTPAFWRPNKMEEERKRDWEDQFMNELIARSMRGY